MADQQTAVAAAQAYAAAARIQSAQAQWHRWQKANHPAAANAAYHLAQRAVGRLYEALSELPGQNPAARAAQAVLDSLNLAYRPNTPPPDKAHAQRLAVIAAAAVAGDILNIISRHRRPNDADLRRRLAKIARAEVKAADRPLTPLPAQHDDFKREITDALGQARGNVQEITAIYRSGLPFKMMPALAAAGLKGDIRRDMLGALNRETAKSMHILITTPADNRDGEIALASTQAFIHKQTRYLKTTGEDYPDDYPRKRAASLSEYAIGELERQAEKYREPDNREFCRQTALQAHILLEHVKGYRHAAITGRITSVSQGRITIVTATRAKAAPVVVERARQLLEREALMSVEYDANGGVIAKAVIPNAP